MREIKFRAWDNKQNLMLHPMEFQSGVGVSIPNEYLSHDDTEIYLRCRYDTELMQYTGLKDKNDKEIYEGDILFRDLGHEVVNETFKVVFEKGIFVTDKIVCFGQGLCVKMSIGSFNRNKELEVIGNIYENPEML